MYELESNVYRQNVNSGRCGCQRSACIALLTRKLKHGQKQTSNVSMATMHAFAQKFSQAITSHMSRDVAPECVGGVPQSRVKLLPDWEGDDVVLKFLLFKPCGCLVDWVGVKPLCWRTTYVKVWQHSLWRCLLSNSVGRVAGASTRSARQAARPLLSER